ncbi:MAG: cupin-like domain-containing protein [Cyanosarcina radialis HA8281-LM2]|jgi:lysine-specific demethylase 8/hypoxia-inducible factor 1-alpha inhibitor (HIF hydroxylase)|nr:cupin-like domain-containing protein [Cyanosarcina radialis HA8281-LM2]
MSDLVNSIPRVDILSVTPETFSDRYQKNGNPVVITGLLEEGDWNLEYLCDRLGDREFILRFYGHERYKRDKRQWKSIGSGVESQGMPFVKYAELLRNRQAHEQDIYLAKCSLKDTSLTHANFFPKLGEKLGLKQPVTDFNLWMGPGGHIECLHYDTLDSTLIQMHGAKKVVLFPPSQTFNLYPFPVFGHLWHGLKLRCWFSRVYPEQPDFKSFPKLQVALDRKYEVIIDRGELLYIPAGWWHEVTALGDEMVCSVNRFWRSRNQFSWTTLRVYLGFLCAAPQVLLSLAIAFFSPNRDREIRKILQMI